MSKKKIASRKVKKEKKQEQLNSSEDIKSYTKTYEYTPPGKVVPIDIRTPQEREFDERMELAKAEATINGRALALFLEEIDHIFNRDNLALVACHLITTQTNESLRMVGKRTIPGNITVEYIAR